MKFKSIEEQNEAYKEFYAMLIRDFQGMSAFLKKAIGEDVVDINIKKIKQEVQEWEFFVKQSLRDFNEKREKHLSDHEVLLRKSRFEIDVNYDLIALTLKAKEEFKNYINLFDDFLKFKNLDKVDKSLVVRVTTISGLIFNDYINKKMMLEYVDQFGIPYNLTEMYRDLLDS